VEPFLTQEVRAMSSPADLIAARIRRLERVISELRDLHQEVEAEDARIQGQWSAKSRAVVQPIEAAKDADQPPGKPVAAPSEPPLLKLRDRPRPPGQAVHQCQIAIARLLERDGPQRRGVIEESYRCGADVRTLALKSGWFRKVNPEQVTSPWELTEQGRAALAELPSQAEAASQPAQEPAEPEADW
jgi:hypothetical protein